MSETKIRMSKQSFWDANVDVNSKKITNLGTPTENTDAVTKLYVDSILSNADAMVFKGTIGTGGTYTIANFNSLATYEAGWTYRVTEAGTIKGVVCEVGDLVIALVDRAGSGNVNGDFTVAQTNIDGAVVGASSSTDNAIARWDSTTGKLIQNSLVTVDDNGSINIPTGQTYKINGTNLSKSDVGLGNVTNDAQVKKIASSTDNAVVRWDGTDGNTPQNSLVTIDDNGSINIPTGQTYKINNSALTQDNIGDGTTYKQYSSTEKTKLSGIETNADVTDAGNVGSSINGSSAKETLVDGDKFAIIDSESSNVLKTSLWSLIKSTLKTYFDSIYSASGHTHSYLASSNYVTREAVTGTKNGSNTTFTIANSPKAGTEMLFVNGVLMNPGAGNDYTISDKTITMAVAPLSTDVILCTYWK